MATASFTTAEYYPLARIVRLGLPAAEQTLSGTVKASSDSNEIIPLDEQRLEEPSLTSCGGRSFFTLNYSQPPANWLPMI